MPVFTTRFPRPAVPWEPETFMPASLAGWWSYSQPTCVANLPNMGLCLRVRGSVTEMEKGIVLTSGEPAVCGQIGTYKYRIC